MIWKGGNKSSISSSPTDIIITKDPNFTLLKNDTMSRVSFFTNVFNLFYWRLKGLN